MIIVDMKHSQMTNDTSINYTNKRLQTPTYNCDQCNYKITMSDHLKHHVGIHSNGKHIDLTNVNMKVKVTTI